VWIGEETKRGRTRACDCRRSRASCSGSRPSRGEEHDGKEPSVSPRLDEDDLRDGRSLGPHFRVAETSTTSTPATRRRARRAGVAVRRSRRPPLTLYVAERSGRRGPGLHTASRMPRRVAQAWRATAPPTRWRRPKSPRAGRSHLLDAERRDREGSRADSLAEALDTRVVNRPDPRSGERASSPPEKPAENVPDLATASARGSGTDATHTSMRPSISDDQSSSGRRHGAGPPT